MENFWANPAGEAHSIPPDPVAGGEGVAAPPHEPRPRSRPSAYTILPPMKNSGRTLELNHHKNCFKCPSVNDFVPEAIAGVPRVHNCVDEVVIVAVNSINARVRYRRPTQADAEPRPTERVRGGTGR